VVGGGIRSAEAALAACNAGADIIVVGNAIEKDPSLLNTIAAAIHQVNA
jgi:putative glycerol-1-phosphate prenyltransferase